MGLPHPVQHDRSSEVYQSRHPGQKDEVFEEEHQGDIFNFFSREKKNKKQNVFAQNRSALQVPSISAFSASSPFNSKKETIPPITGYNINVS